MSNTKFTKEPGIGGAVGVTETQAILYGVALGLYYIRNGVLCRSINECAAPPFFVWVTVSYSWFPIQSPIAPEKFQGFLLSRLFLSVCARGGPNNMAEDYALSRGKTEPQRSQKSPETIDVSH